MRRGNKPDFTRKDAHDHLYFEMKFDREKEIWQLREKGKEKVIDSADTKKELMRSAREHAESKHAHLNIYHVDGSLEVENDYTKHSPQFHYGER